MAVLTTDDKTEIIVSCRYGSFYSEQDETIWRIICKKLRKIWAIIRNKDFYYSDVIMSKSDFVKFREMINSMEVDV